MTRRPPRPNLIDPLVPYTPLFRSDDAARQLTGYSSRGMGPGQRAVRDHVHRLQSNMAQRMRQHVDESLGSTVNPHQQAANLTEQARAAAAPLYREAYQ